MLSDHEHGASIDQEDDNEVAFQGDHGWLLVHIGHSPLRRAWTETICKHTVTVLKTGHRRRRSRI